jgi:magnesium transporter
MARFLKSREESDGKSPGALIFIGDQKVDSAKIRLIDYDSASLTEKEIKDIHAAAHLKTTPTVTWLNINGLHDIEMIQNIGKIFQLHPLVMEDLLNTGQRPKLEEFEDYIFIVLKMVRFDNETETIFNEQLSLVFGKNFLLTFQEQPREIFKPVRERIKKSTSRIRKTGTDYLAYALIDTVVDNYIFSIETLGEKIEDLEDDILNDPDSDVMEKINSFKREINYMRKSIRPAKDAIYRISRLDSELIQEQTLPFLKDLEDLTSQATEAIETYRDLLTDQLNIYNSVMANKMNDIMKVLTIFAAIFIPLTFIAGIYGTNFEYLPELKYKYSYFIFWAVMISVAGALIVYFKRKNWF